MTKAADDAPDGFLSRWSRRKAAVKQGQPVAGTPQAQAPVPASTGPVAQPSGQHCAEASPAAPVAAPPPPAPTLDDAARLTPQSDFSRFVAANVDPRVRNAAMKKLFADPHFNVMDGLDIYIDDYNKFEPLTGADLKQLVNARALGLIDDAAGETREPGGAKLATDNGPETSNPADENADLQLQPHDAAGRPGAGQGIAGDADREGPAPDPVPPRSA